MPNTYLRSRRIVSWHGLGTGTMVRGTRYDVQYTMYNGKEMNPVTN